MVTHIVYLRNVNIEHTNPPVMSVQWEAQGVVEPAGGSNPGGMPSGNFILDPLPKNAREINDAVIAAARAAYDAENLVIDELVLFNPAT